MHRFLIGQHGRFDYSKFQRDFRPGFYGIEACLLESGEDIQALIDEAEKHAFRVGIHFPLRAGGPSLRDALFLAQDDEVRKEAFAYAERELEAAVRVKPEYILFHYPKPVILDDRVDWRHWRFSDPSEYVYESAYDLETFLDRSERLFSWLTEKGKAYGFRPVLEFDALNRYVYDTGEVVKLLQRYPDIKLCLDTGRLFQQEKLDPYLDVSRVLRTYAPYAASIHLWTLQVLNDGSGVRHSHFPALPALDPADGWAPIEAYLQIIAEINPDVNILFEHRSDWISDEELEACYQWIHRLMGGKPSE